MALTITVRNGGAAGSTTLDITNRLRADQNLALGNRCHQGESAQSTITLDDDNGEVGNYSGLPGGLTAWQVSAHNVVTVTETAPTPDVVLVRGRVIPKDFSREDLGNMGRSRQVSMKLDDYNADLKGMAFLASYARPVETDVARATWVYSTFLSGSPRLTTSLTNGIVATDAVSMPAKTYDAGTQPLEVLQDCALAANKIFCVMSNGTFYYAPLTDTSQVAGIRISDRLDELDTSIVCASGSSSTVSSAEGEGNNGQSIGTVTVASGSGGLISVCMTAETQATPTVTWKPDDTNGATDQVMTIIGTVTHPTPSTGTNKDGEKLWIAWLANPNASTANAPGIVWASVTSNYGSLFGYWTISSSATPTVYTNTGTGTTSTVTPTANAADLVLDCAGYRFWSLGNDSNTPSPTASQTSNWTVAYNNSAGQNDSAWGGGQKLGSGVRTWNLVKNTNWAAAAIVIPGSSPVPTFPPIWLGPASTEDGQELLSGGVLNYPDGFVTENRSGIVSDYDYWVETIHDAGALNAADAANRLSKMIDVQQYEDRTYNVAVQLHRDQVGCVRAGQMIDIKARAIPDADDAFVVRRIASLEWQMLGPEHYLAVMELDRPAKTGARTPGSSAAAKATVMALAADPDHVRWEPVIWNGEVVTWGGDVVMHKVFI